MKLLRQATYLAVLTALSHAAGADDARQQFKIDIASQPLDEALLEFSRQASVQVILQSAEGKNLTAPKVTGSFTWEAALSKLLSNTDLRYEFLNERTVAIVSTQTDRASLNLQDDQWSRFLLAQSDSSSSAYPSNEAVKAGQPVSEGRGEIERLEEVVVTAQKRKEVLKDVPISMTVLNGKDLDRATGEGVLDALNRVPGISMQGVTMGGMTHLAVRGVSAGAGIVSGSSPVAYYLDSVPFAFARNAIVPDVSPYDLERVEVLRGPQGTLYGASALNGVVRVLTNDPDVNDFDFKARVSTSSTSRGGENYRGDAAFNIPLIEGKLAARAVVGYQDQGGWIETAYAENANEASIRNARLKLKYEPTEDLSIGLSAWNSLTKRDMPDVGNDDYFHDATRREPIKIDMNVYSLDIGYDFSGFSLASASSYLDQTSDSTLDLSVYRAFGLNDTLHTNFPITVFSQELYLRSSGEGPWRWSVGGMYREEKEHIFQIRFDNTTGEICCTYVAPTDYVTASKAVAMFGEVTRIFFDGRIELTGGLRHFKDDESADELSRLDGSPPSEFVHPRSSFDALSPRLVATWHAQDRLTLYASYAEGFRSGVDQLNSVLVGAPQFQPVDADTLVNYETGVKGSTWGGRMGFEAAVYFMDWSDVQQSLPVYVATLQQVGVINSGDASGPGVDFAVTVKPVQGLELGVNLSWNDLKFKEDVLMPGGFLYAGGDERLVNSAEYTAGAFVDYSVALGQNLIGRVSLAGNFTSEQLQRAIPQGATGVSGDAVVTEGDSMFNGRASVSIEGREHWSATLFAENVTDENGAIFGNPSDPFGPRIRPRTVGLQLEYRFGR